MIHVGPYTIYTTRQRPWASVYDADGFPDTFCNTSVTFVAWQDQPPGHVRAEARP